MITGGAIYPMAEAEVKSRARKILKEHGVFFIDIQGSRFTTAGAPDLVAIIDGMFIALEFKTYRGRQSEDQKMMERNIVDAGGLYFLPRSVKDVLDILALFGR